MRPLSHCTNNLSGNTVGSATRKPGYTIIELVVVLAIVSLLTLTAIPGIQGFTNRNKTTVAVNRLVGAVNLTRHAAVQFHGIATLCALKGSGRCGASWAGELTVFMDRNSNAELDPDETIVNRISRNSPDTTVTWRAFQNKQYLQMMPMGYTNYQNGNFVVCPADGDQQFARQLVINIQGRVRHNHSVNETGYPVDRKGKLLRC